MARPIFCGNFEYDARESDLERLFRRYGRVERVDMKTGFAFIYMEEERDADDAIRGLDRIEFGRMGRKLRVEWTKDRDVRSHLAPRRPPSANTKPSKTLFVINFDTHQTRQKDLERHFESYGKIMNVRIRKNFAFIQYETQEDATEALDATNNSKLLGRVLSVEYAVRDDDDRSKGFSHDRSRDISPGRRGHERRRSPSPYRRDRGSPDYGRGPSPRLNRKERASPDYGRRRIPSPSRRGRPSPDYGRGSSHSPRQRDRARDDHAHASSRSPYLNQNDRGRPENGRSTSPAPYRRERASPDNERGSSHSLLKREGSSPVRGRGHGRSRSPYGRQKDSPENGGNCSPNSNPEAQPSNNFAEDDSPMHQSRSPPAEE